MEFKATKDPCADLSRSCEIMCLRLCVLARGYALTSADPPRKDSKAQRRRSLTSDRILSQIRKLHSFIIAVCDTWQKHNQLAATSTACPQIISSFIH